MNNTTYLFGNVKDITKPQISTLGCCHIAYLIWKDARTMNTGTRKSFIGAGNKKVTKILTKKIKKSIQKEWERVQTFLQKHYTLTGKKIYRLSSVERRFLHLFIDDVVYIEGIREISTNPAAKESGDNHFIICFENLYQMLLHAIATWEPYNPIVDEITEYINHEIIPDLYTSILKIAFRKLNDDEIKVYNNNHELKGHIYSLKVACQNLYKQQQLVGKKITINYNNEQIMEEE